VGTAEEEYIAREEADRQREYVLDQQHLAAQVEQNARGDAQERTKQAHFMRCPQCATPLYSAALRGVQIDRCDTCGGVWAGVEQLERLTESRSGFFRSLTSLFR
jgi:hypothetical protein